MKKFLITSTLSLVTAISLNAAVYATVNGQNITEADVEPILAGIGVQNIDQLPPEVKKQVISRAIDMKLLTDTAIKSGVKNDALYKSQLKLAEQTIALRVWEYKKMQNMKVTDAQIQAAYNKDKAQFTRPPLVQASHILVKNKSEADAIIKQLKPLSGAALKTKFAELAKAKSIEPAAKQSGGSLGQFSADMMVEPFSKAAFAMKDGTISTSPVQTQFGYHVIYKEASSKAEIMPLAQVKPYIENSLKEEAFKKWLDGEIQRLQKSAKIVYK